MKTNFIPAFFALLLLICSCNQNKEQEQEIRVNVTNRLDVEWKEAPVYFSHTWITEQMEIPARELPVLIDEEGEFVQCQADDLDGDGTWDELFGLVDLDPNESIVIAIRSVPEDEYPEFEPRTNIRLGAYTEDYTELLTASRLEGVSYDNHSLTGEAFQMEGPAWENDLVGFRNYLDQRNGLDIFGKTTRQLVLDSVGLKGGHSYHERDWWGQDILKVGTSLGAGGVAFVKDDSLYRLGDNGTGTYEFDFEGPIRSRFKLSFRNWMVGDDSYDVDQWFTIVAGTRFYESRLAYRGPEGVSTASGIVNMLTDTLYTIIRQEAHTGLYTHGIQTEDTTILAMGLVVPNKQLKHIRAARDNGDGITQTYYAVFWQNPDQEITYRFYSLWAEEDPRWTTVEEVNQYLKTEIKKWAAPPRLEVLP